MISKMIARTGAAILLAGLTLPVAVQPAAAANAVAQGSAVAKEKRVNEKGERLICRRLEVTGSRMKSFKACHTAEEWKAIYRDM